MTDLLRPICERGLARRSFLTLSGVLSLGFPQLIREALGMGLESAPSLLSAQIELSGNWKSSPADAVLRVLTRMREASLDGVRLLSDRQPDKIRVDSHESGPPAIWLHDDHSRIAWIIVDIGTDDWSKLSYQFGHELGHVFCNSWNEKSQPHFPCQWLEESMVEAFSIRGLARLASSWERNPPFAGDSAFSASIRQYRDDQLKRYNGAGGQKTDPEIAAWFRASRGPLEQSALSEIEGPFIVRVVGELESDPAFVEDMGALNRWPARSSIPLDEYLKSWEKSCSEIHAPGRLPTRLRSLLGVS
jgi:hypothetical protein